MDIYTKLDSFGLERAYSNAFTQFENSEEFVNEYNNSEEDSRDKIIDKYSNIILEAMGKKIYNEITGSIVSENPYEYFLKGFIKEMINKGNTVIYDEELETIIDSLK